MTSAVPKTSFEVRSPDGAIRRTGTVSDGATVIEIDSPSPACSATRSAPPT